MVLWIYDKVLYEVRVLGLVFIFLENMCLRGRDSFSSVLWKM